MIKTYRYGSINLHRNEIYNFIFTSLQNQFTSLFPADISSLDEVYLWQFLSAMAVGASGIEHQRILVTEVRYLLCNVSENVIKTSKSDDVKALDNVNLFLKALGLQIDAKQLAAMG
jgi:DNA topoisomerase 2-associated protein PAT1